MNTTTHRIKLRFLTTIIFAATGFFAASACNAVDLSDPNNRTLFIVPQTHLDTQWYWTGKRTINEFIPNTFNGNFYLINKYPDYIFNWEGAIRYMFTKEYYPDAYQQIVNHVGAGNWYPTGSALENGDTNVISPENLLRQILIGNNFFEDEMGVRSTDIFIPDSFGYSYTLPSVAAHCGLNGFSSMKLDWGSAIPIPFDIGRWMGPDGTAITAVLKPGAVNSCVSGDLSNDGGWINKINYIHDNYSGLYAGYQYIGNSGDQGGAPPESCVSSLQTSVNGSGPLNVVAARGDELFEHITAGQLAAMSTHNGELLMKTHGVGCYSAVSPVKRWNRQNEQLADAAERAAAIADWLGGSEYPSDRLREAWIRFLWHTHHDDITGTSHPDAYDISWNDQLISLNEFAGIMQNGVGSAARAMDTQTTGQPVVVYNPLSYGREDVVEAEVRFESGLPSAVRVYDHLGVEVPSQIEAMYGDTVVVVFTADMPATGLKVYDIRPTSTPCELNTGLSVTVNQLENERYRVTINGDGDISSILDKQSGREMLGGSARMQLQLDDPRGPEGRGDCAAWEIYFKDTSSTPLGYVGAPAAVDIVEDGPARVMLQITRNKDGSKYIQNISLGSGGAGSRVDIDTVMDWRTENRLLKASFPFTVYNSHATYDLQLGTIQRPNANYNLYEVPAQQWADITDSNGAYGVSILNDCKYGWDKPNDNTLRLTLIHSPTGYNWYNTDYQKKMDFGEHRFKYSIYGHSGDWRSGDTALEAMRINQPLYAFQSAHHSGVLGRSYSFLSVNQPGKVAVRALKQAERSSEWIVRVQELHGGSVSNVELSVGSGIASAREVNGAEQSVGPATVSGGKLIFNLSAYQPRTFAIELNSSPASLSLPAQQVVSLPHDLDGFSFDSARGDGDFEGGHTYPAELLPDTLTVHDITFDLGPTTNGQNNVMVCNGQTIALPGQYDDLYLLAAAVCGDQSGVFEAGGESYFEIVQDYSHEIGTWGGEGSDTWGGQMCYLKRQPIGFVATHRHHTGGNEALQMCYMFLHKLDLPAGATSVTLPENSHIRIFAMTAADHPGNDITAVQPLYDKLPFMPRVSSPIISPSSGVYNESVTVTMLPVEPVDAAIRYTLDGSDPTESSTLYTGAISITDSTTIKARAYKSGLSPSAVSISQILMGQEGDGLFGEYYSDRELSTRAMIRIDPRVDFTWDLGSPDPAVGVDNFSVRWSGYVQPLYGEEYTFYTATDDGVRLWVDNQLLINEWVDQGGTEHMGSITLVAGRKYPIRMEYYEGGGGAQAHLSWSSASQAKQIIPQSRMSSVDTPLNAPDNVTVSPVSATEIIVTWDDTNSDPNEDGYVIQRKPYHGVNQWHEVGQVSANVTSYTDTDSISGFVQYTYRVGAAKN